MIGREEVRHPLIVLLLLLAGGGGGGVESNGDWDRSSGLREGGNVVRLDLGVRIQSRLVGELGERF